jgi:hypothetical protein
LLAYVTGTDLSAGSVLPVRGGDARQQDDRAEQASDGHGIAPLDSIRDFPDSLMSTTIAGLFSDSIAILGVNKPLRWLR